MARRLSPQLPAKSSGAPPEGDVPGTNPSTLSPARRLRLLLSLGGGPLLTAAGAFWGHPELPRLFPRFLLEVHGIVRASVPLLDEAALLARERRERGARELAEYLAHHAEEERGHDAWLREDLETLGIGAASAMRHVPSPTVSGLVGRQHYLVRHAHPAALLGYLAVIEGFPATVREVAAIARRARVPIKAVRTMSKHARLDPGHRDELDRVVDRLPLHRRVQDLVVASSLATLADLTELFVFFTPQRRSTGAR